MDINDNVNRLSRYSTSLVFLSFCREGPCQNDQFKLELDKLGHLISSGLVPDLEIADNLQIDPSIECDGVLEADGHSTQRSMKSLQQEFSHQIQAELPDNAQEVNVMEVAAEIIRIADDFNHDIISQAAERLTKQLNSSSTNCWWMHLSQQVESLRQQVPETEQAMMALTFSLVKAACELAPNLLWDLYHVLMRCTPFARPR